VLDQYADMRAALEVLRKRGACRAATVAWVLGWRQGRHLDVIRAKAALQDLEAVGLAESVMWKACRGEVPDV